MKIGRSYPGFLEAPNASRDRNCSYNARLTCAACLASPSSDALKSPREAISIFSFIPLTMPNQPNAEQNPAVPANATAAPELPARVTAARGRILKLVHELKCIHDVVSDEVSSGMSPLASRPSCSPLPQNYVATLPTLSWRTTTLSPTLPAVRSRCTVGPSSPNPSLPGIAEKCAIPYDHHSSISAVSGQGEVGARLRSLNKMQWAPAFEKMGISDFIDLRVIAVLRAWIVPSSFEF